MTTFTNIGIEFSDQKLLRSKERNDLMENLRISESLWDSNILLINKIRNIHDENFETVRSETTCDPVSDDVAAEKNIKF